MMVVLKEAKKRLISRLECQPSGTTDLNEEVVVTRPLSSKEVLGVTGRDDFPLLRGNEVLMQAIYRGSEGQVLHVSQRKLQRKPGGGAGDASC